MERRPVVADASADEHNAQAVESSRDALVAAIKNRGKPQDDPADSEATDPRNALLASIKNRKESTMKGRDVEPADPRNASLVAINSR